jgi:hypothetical protein
MRWPNEAGTIDSPLYISMCCCQRNPKLQSLFTSMCWVDVELRALDRLVLPENFRLVLEIGVFVSSLMHQSHPYAMTLDCEHNFR